jgi:hypothetical protein
MRIYTSLAVTFIITGEIKKIIDIEKHEKSLRSTTSNFLLQHYCHFLSGKRNKVDKIPSSSPFSSSSSPSSSSFFFFCYHSAFFFCSSSTIATTARQKKMRFSRSARVPLTIMIPYLMATGKANKPLCKVHNRCHDQQLDFVSCFDYLYEI